MSEANETELPKLTWVRDLEAFEGPILSEREDADGVPYLEKWCTYSDSFTRYLVVRSTRAAIDAYLDGRMSMLELLTVPNDDAGWLVDYAGGELYSAETVRVSVVPASYLPKASAMHEEDLRPVGFKR